MSRTVVSLGLVVCALGGACAWPVTMWVPSTTPLEQPAQPFRTIPAGEVKTVMHRLANDLVMLDDALADATARQQEVVAALDDMRDAVATITAGGGTTDHPQLETAFEQFAFDIETARNAAAYEPPSFTAASTVSAMCLRCHRQQ